MEGVSKPRRIRRATPERTGPIRSWSNVFGPPGPGRERAQASSESPAPGGGTPSGDAVARAVDLGYRVVDEYIRQGQNAARLLSDRAYGPEAMASDAQELASRMVRYASDFAGVWFELMGMATTGRPTTAGSAAGGDGSPARPPPAAPPGAADGAAERRAAPTAVRTHVAVELESPLPTEVILDLQPSAPSHSLAVHDLRSVEAEQPRITGIGFEGGVGAEPVRLRIRIPPDQPPGTYNGIVVDGETSLPAGTLCVRVASRRAPDGSG